MGGGNPSVSQKHLCSQRGGGHFCTQVLPCSSSDSLSVLDLNSPGCKWKPHFYVWDNHSGEQFGEMPGEWERDSKKSEAQEDQRGPPDIFLYLPPHSEKAMAPHSSILAWKIPWTEEPGGLRGSLRVRHDWSGLAAAAAATSLSPGVTQVSPWATWFLPPPSSDSSILRLSSQCWKRGMDNSSREQEAPRKGRPGPTAQLQRRPNLLFTETQCPEMLALGHLTPQGPYPARWVPQ